MNHNKLTYKQLLALQNFNLDNLSNKIRKFKHDWVKNKVCDCTAVEGCEVYCNHMKKYLKGFFKDEEKEIKKINIELIKRTTCSSNLNQQWLDNF